MTIDRRPLYWIHSFLLQLQFIIIDDDMHIMFIHDDDDERWVRVLYVIGMMAIANRLTTIVVEY